jgi:hypothetical protein
LVVGPVCQYLVNKSQVSSVRFVRANLVGPSCQWVLIVLFPFSTISISDYPVNQNRQDRKLHVVLQLIATCLYYTISHAHTFAIIVQLYKYNNLINFAVASTWSSVHRDQLGVCWYVSNVSIIFDAPCLFLHHLLSVLLYFVAFLCIFWN